MKRTPLPNNGNGRQPVVRATLVESRAPRGERGTIDDDALDMSPEKAADMRARDHVGSSKVIVDTDAPWSPVPLRHAREFLRANPDARIEVIFPTVYEEDRSKKLQDLTVAETVGVVTHQRMAEQMAKELGFDSYGYDAEMQAIEIEHATLPPYVTQGVPDTTGVARSGSATGLGDLPAMPDVSVRRADLSGDSKAEFRRQQKTQATERQIRRLRRQLRTVLRRVAEAKPPVVNVTIEPPKPKHVVITRDGRGLLQEMREVAADATGSDGHGRDAQC